MTTLDGYYEGPNQEFDFWVIDEEFNRFAVDQLDEADTLCSAVLPMRAWRRTGRRPRASRTTRRSPQG
jgi:hypothetical protein